jgi:hypothetical protein
MKKLAAILLGIMLLTVTVTTVIDLGQSADAVKAMKKSPRHSHVNNRGNQVCGDELCPGQPWIKRIRN